MIQLIIRAYRRVSTEEQADEGFSLPAQQQRIIAYCHSQWGKAVQLAWYEDDGYSAKDLNRPALGRLLRDVRAGDSVVCLRLDRLTRSVLDLYTLLQKWEAAGVGFKSVTEPYDTTKSEGKFFIGLIALLAQWERERIGERVREVMSYIVAKETRPLSRAPLGYDLADGHYVVNQREAELVRTIFALYLGGRGTRAVAADLNRKGARTKRGSEWTDFAVAYTLRNPVYTGKLSWNRVVYKGRRRTSTGGGLDRPEVVLVDAGHETIIDTATWEAAQALLSQRKRVAPRSATGNHVLTGLALCTLCGGPIHGVTQRRYRNGRQLPGRERAYYRCSTRDHKQTCDLPWFPAPKLEAAVLDCLSNLGRRETLRALAGSLLHEPDAAGQDRELREGRLRLKQLGRDRAFYDDLLKEGDITRQEWRERTAAIRTEQAALHDQLEHLAAAPPVRIKQDDLTEVLRSLSGVWETLTAPERKTVLHGLVRAVHVTGDGSVKVIPRIEMPTAATPDGATPAPSQTPDAR